MLQPCLHLSTFVHSADDRPAPALQQPCHHVPKAFLPCAHPFCCIRLVLCSHFSSVQLAHSCSAPFTSDQVPSSVPDLMGIVSSMTEENQAALTATCGNARPRDPRRLCQRPPFPRMSPQHCRPKGRLLKTCLSLALKSRPWCRSSTLPGQKTSCISPAVKTKSLGPTSSHQSCAGRLYACTSAFPRRIAGQARDCLN